MPSHWNALENAKKICANNEIGNTAAAYDR